MESVKRASIVLSLVLLCGAAAADESFFAYADVVHVEPLFETRRVPVRREVCRQAEESAFELATRARSGPSGGEDLGDLARAIEEEAASARARSQERVCEQVTDYATERRIRAYRVTYQYRGALHEAETDTDPGEKLRVRVRVGAVGDSSSNWR